MSAPKEANYKVICVSMFKWDLAELDQMVESLKARGLARANRSWLIRYALDKIQVDDITREDVYGG